jgi:L-fuconolactonase
MRVDAYHHLWRYTPSAFDWIDERMQSLRRDFLLIDLEPELAAASVDTTVVFQAR